MKKILILFTALSLIGCGTIKKNKQQESSKQTNDFKGSKFDFNRSFDSSFTLRPFDASKAMIVGKDTIYNTIIERHYKDRIQVIKDTIHKVDVVEVEKQSKIKETDNSKVYFYLFGFGFGFLALIILVAMWHISKRLPKFDKV